VGCGYKFGRKKTVNGKASKQDKRERKPENQKIREKNERKTTPKRDRTLKGENAKGERGKGGVALGGVGEGPGNGIVTRKRQRGNRERDQIQTKNRKGGGCTLSQRERTAEVYPCSEQFLRKKGTRPRKKV